MNRFTWAALAIAVLCASAYAQNPSYSLPKDFTLTPTAGAAVTIGFNDFEHAWWNSPPNKEAVTSNQAATFTEFGYDGFAKLPGAGKLSLVNTDTKPNADGSFAPGSGFTPVVLTFTAVPAAGLNKVFSAKAGPAPQFVIHSTADTNVTVPQQVAGQAVKGTVSVDGNFDKGLNAYAFSYGGLQFTGATAAVKNAKASAAPIITVGRAGNIFTKTARQWDPVSFELLDSSSNVIVSDTVMNLIASTDDNASVTINSLTGAVHLDTGAGGLAAIHLSVNPSYVSPGQGGSLDLEIHNGIVTVSSATGRYAGKSLPALNAALSNWDNLTLGSNDLTMDLALDPFITGNTQSIRIDSESAGLITDVPEPTAGVSLLLSAGLLLARRLSRRNVHGPEHAR